MRAKLESGVSHLYAACLKITLLSFQNFQSINSNKMNVLHCLALQSEALVILLQETHCTDVEKLVLPSYQLAGFSLSRKHSLVMFVHERLKSFWTNFYRHRRLSDCAWRLMAIK